MKWKFAILYQHEKPCLKFHPYIIAKLQKQNCSHLTFRRVENKKMSTLMNREVGAWLLINFMSTAIFLPFLCEIINHDWFKTIGLRLRETPTLKFYASPTLSSIQFCQWWHQKKGKDRIKACISFIKEDGMLSLMSKTY